MASRRRGDDGDAAILLTIGLIAFAILLANIGTILTWFAIGFALVVSIAGIAVVLVGLIRLVIWAFENKP